MPLSGGKNTSGLAAAQKYFESQHKNNLDDLGFLSGVGSDPLLSRSVSTARPRWSLPMAHENKSRELLEMIGMRLRVPVGVQLFDFIAAHAGPRTTFVFVVSKGQPVTLEDDNELFPSDALVTQLRLLK